MVHSAGGRMKNETPGLDLSRSIVVGFLIAAAIGLLAGIGWLGYLLGRADSSAAVSEVRACRQRSET